MQRITTLKNNLRIMADGVRFELTVGRTYAGFQDRCLKPLDHPSAIRRLYTTDSNLATHKTPLGYREKNGYPMGHDPII
jgi:hypothetical protein